MHSIAHCTVFFRCLAGFSGQFCEIEVNECNSSPCLHGSTCEDHVSGYTCQCQKGNRHLTGHWLKFHLTDENF